MSETAVIVMLRKVYFDSVEQVGSFESEET